MGLPTYLLVDLTSYLFAELRTSPIMKTVDWDVYDSRRPQPPTTVSDHNSRPQPPATASDHSLRPQAPTTAPDHNL